MKAVWHICDVKTYVSLHSPYFIEGLAAVDSRGPRVSHHQCANRLIGSFYDRHALSDALDSVSYVAAGIQDEGFFTPKAEVIPFFGVVVVTGVPQPLDGRLRDAIHGASEDLSAAQWVERWAWKGRHGLFVDLRFH